MGDQWDLLVQAFEDTFGTDSCDVTRRALALGERDSTTGWRAKSFTESTIQMIVLVQGATYQNLVLGTYVKLDAVGLTDTLLGEGDEINVGTQYFEVKTVKERYSAPAVVDFYESDLVKLPLHE